MPDEGVPIPRAIRLSPDECAYIAVCNMPPSFKEISYAAKNGLSHELDLKTLSLNNSMLLEAVRNGYGNVLSLRSYFEGMDDKGHDLQLLKKYKEVLSLFKRMNAPVFQETKRKIDVCSVKVGQKKNGEYEIWFPSGTRKEDISTEYLPRLADGDMFTIHGAYAIRKLDDEQVIEELKRLPGIWSGVLK